MVKSQLGETEASADNRKPIAGRSRLVARFDCDGIAGQRWGNLDRALCVIFPAFGGHTSILYQIPNESKRCQVILAARDACGARGDRPLCKRGMWRGEPG